MSQTPPPKPPTASSASNNYGSTQAVRQLYNAQQSSRTGNAAYGAQVQAVSDPYNKLVGFKTGFQDTGRMVMGYIVDGTAIANCYKVFVEKGRAPVIAAAASGTSHVCFGASAINTYAPGTPVILMLHDKIGQAFIVGAVPSVIDVGIRAYHDYISQASRKRADDCHKKYIKMPINGQMVDWSGWRPFDATLASEWGAISTTGIGVSVDDFMFRASVNEFCGVYGFYHDSLLRVAGYNMQVWTAGSERDAYMDQAECNDTSGYSPYPWEALGLLNSGSDAVEEYQPRDYQTTKGKPYYSHWENKHEYQQPYHRTQQFFGYLGQGLRTVVHAPPEGLDRWTYKPAQGSSSPAPAYDSDITSSDGLSPDTGGGGADKLKSHQEKPVFGLSEQNTALDGRHFITSAKGVVIAKRILLPVPQRLRRPESGEGDDTDQEYKAASKFGGGPEHKITGDIKTTDEKHPNLQRAAAVLDLHGYLFNYAGLHPFYWHAKDYKTWEQSELTYAQTNQKIPIFSELQGSMYLRQEEPKQFKIDHRYNQQNFYETECFMSLLEDGSVVIGDGYGAEIRMSGGCIFLSAPGDVWLKSGRDVQMWSGSDTVVRAKNSVDISTTEKNVRIKSEKNVLVLAGNSEQEGGILLESRGKTPTYDFEKPGDDVRFSGVVLRAVESNIVSLSREMYLRAGANADEPGSITLDAGKGKGDIITKSQALYNYVAENGEIMHFFQGNPEAPVEKTNMFRKDFTLMCGPLGLDKDIILNGNVLCSGKLGFLATEGHIVTKGSAKGNKFVSPCDGDCSKEVNDGINKIRDLIDKELPQTGTNVQETYLGSLWYDAKQAGNDDVIKIMEFSFRTDDQYNVEDFVLYEDRWQQMARIGGSEPEKWTEKPVITKVDGPSWPFPGKKWLIEEPAYTEQNLKIAEKQGGGFRDKDRGTAPGLTGAYSQPEFESNSPKTLNGNYPIIPRPQKG